jgi:hypothetical protein
MNRPGNPTFVRHPDGSRSWRERCLRCGSTGHLAKTCELRKVAAALGLSYEVLWTRLQRCDGDMTRAMAVKRGRPRRVA